MQNRREKKGRKGRRGEEKATQDKTTQGKTTQDKTTRDTRQESNEKNRKIIDKNETWFAQRE